MSHYNTIAESKANYFYMKKASTTKKLIHYIKNVKPQTHLTVIQMV